MRPNPAALTTVKIKLIDFNNMIIEIQDTDAFDKTPVIDIKPYIPCIDRVKKFAVPDWVNHWSEWKEEEAEVKKEISVDSMKTSDFELLKMNFAAEIKLNPKEPFLFNSDQPLDMKDTSNIVISGCRQHNLKNISLKIPKNKFTVVTGVSGSGKSTLVFDTIYAESQRRFIDSLSTTGRQAFEQFEKPDVDKIYGLPPAIAVEQKSINRNPRSTVGTMTEIFDYLRLLFSRIGTRHCPDCGAAVKTRSEFQINKLLLSLPEKTKFEIISAENDSLIECLEIPNINEIPAFKIKLKEIVKEALNAGRGAFAVRIEDKKFILHTRNKCYHCGRVFFELTSSYFSFNNPAGMCSKCSGLGFTLTVIPELIVSKPELSILDCASGWWGNLRQQIKKPTGNWWKGEVLALAQIMKIDIEKPWNELPDDFKQKALFGTKGVEVKFKYSSAKGRSGEITRPVEGAVNHITRMFRDTQGEGSRQFYIQFMRDEKCSECHGERLNPESRLVTIADTRYPQAAQMNIRELFDWVQELPNKIAAEELLIAQDLINELFRRLQALLKIGVQYLTLDRPAPTLSGGEAQRLRLASQLNCGLTDLLYVLDEPSIGLHPADHNLLIETMKKIRDAGNTLIVVEHDADTMKSADWLIEIGPGAGDSGGFITAQGKPEDVMNNNDSITGRYLSGDISVRNEIITKTKGQKKFLKLFNCSMNNLKNIDVSFPLGMFICVTGVSGCGKSSLISKTLYPALEAYYSGYSFNKHISKIEGQEFLDKVITVTQSPIGRTPRSNPATYIELFDEIRKVFAKTDEAKKRGFTENYFSFNSKGGRCEACQGAGRKNIEMHFMQDIWVECPECRGKRFNSEILEIKLNGKSIADILEMDTVQSSELFTDNKKIVQTLNTLKEVGLGYLKLGQSSVTLSGGEAQRIKLAKELCKSDTGKTLYLLDEPTTGLHSADIQKLLNLLKKLTQKGNTVIIIEHNIDMIKNADWIIDLGPNGGDTGGYIIAQGTPEEISKHPDSKTGKFINMID